MKPIENKKKLKERAKMKELIGKMKKVRNKVKNQSKKNKSVLLNPLKKNRIIYFKKKIKFSSFITYIR